MFKATLLAFLCLLYYHLHLNKTYTYALGISKPSCKVRSEEPLPHRLKKRSEIDLKMPPVEDESPISHIIREMIKSKPAQMIESNSSHTIRMLPTAHYAIQDAPTQPKQGTKIMNAKPLTRPNDELMRKRALDPSVDLNTTPPEYEQFYSSPKNEQPSDQTSTPVKRVGRKYKKQNLTIEEKRKKAVKAVMASRNRLKERWREALKDPSKMTPKLKQSMEKFQASNRKASNKYYHKLSDKVKNKVPLTENERKRVHAFNRTLEWRNEKPENQKRYEEHQKRNIERAKKRRNKEKE